MPKRILATTLALYLLSTAAPAGATDDGFFVLCHASNPIAQLAPADLKKALTGGTRQWTNGAVVQVGLPSSETAELRFVADAVGLSAQELLSRVQQQVFKGEMKRPIVVRSSAECAALVRSNVGAFCVAAKGTALTPDVKPIPVR